MSAQSSTSTATPVNDIAESTQSWQNTYKDPVYVKRYEELLNKSKTDSSKRVDRVEINAHPYTCTITNRFAILMSSSSSEEELSTLTNDQPLTKPVTESMNKVFQRYRHTCNSSLDMPNIKHQSHYKIDDDMFHKPGDSMYRNYWRYTILKDGTIQCINAASNRKKITQLVLRTRTAPYEYINDVPITNYFAMFRNAVRLQHICLTGLSFSNITSLGRMFSDCVELRTVDMSNLDLSHVTDYQHMFDNCKALRAVDFSGSNMSAAVKLDSMFYGCTSITRITITQLGGNSLQSMNHAFRSCTSLRILELPNLYITEAVGMKKLFYGANRSIDILCPSSCIKVHYLKDMYEESSSSGSPSIDSLNDTIEGNNKDVSIIDETPHVLSEEQRAASFKWAPIPEAIVPTFVPYQ